MRRGPCHQPNSVRSSGFTTVVSTFTWAADSIDEECDAAATSVQVKCGGLQRGLRDGFTGAACILRACSRGEGFAGDAILDEAGFHRSWERFISS